MVGIDGAGDGGSSSGGAGVPVDWAVVGAAVCRVSMAKEDRIRAAWREARVLGFLVNSETRHTEGANNQISEKLGS